MTRKSLLRELTVTLGVATLSFTGSGFVMAQESPADCRNIENPEERLACYDRLANEGRASDAPRPEQAQSENPADDADDNAETPSEAPQENESAGNPDTEARDRYGLPAEDDGLPDSIEIVITDYRRDPYGKWILTTAEGHIWRQTDTRTVYLRGDTVHAEIKKAMIAGFKLTFIDNGRTIRVRRVQ